MLNSHSVCPHFRPPYACSLLESRLMSRSSVLGIAQQTMAHYEGGVSRIAVEPLAQAAVVLRTSI